MQSNTTILRSGFGSQKRLGLEPKGRNGSSFDETGNLVYALVNSGRTTESVKRYVGDNDPAMIRVPHGDCRLG